MDASHSVWYYVSWMIFSKTELNFVERQAFASFKHGFFQVWGKCLPQSFPTPNGVTGVGYPWDIPVTPFGVGNDAMYRIMQDLHIFCMKFLTGNIFQSLSSLRGWLFCSGCWSTAIIFMKTISFTVGFQMFFSMFLSFTLIIFWKVKTYRLQTLLKIYYGCFSFCLILCKLNDFLKNRT